MNHPRVLFLHANQPCYLAEALFHGLRQVLGRWCVDVPRYDSLYHPLDPALRQRLRGNGFTLYGLLPEVPEIIPERYLWKRHLDSWDLVVLANIWEEGELFLEIRRSIPPEKLVVLDGYDGAALFPFALRYASRPWLYLAALRKTAYFKRELMTGGDALGLSRFLPAQLLTSIPVPARTFPISFSIPAEKITRVPAAQKSKLFPRHIVDAEVARQVTESQHSPTGSDQYFFSSEEDYYADLRAARFGVTTKRGGWDCLRHYELAANGCVLCFKGLDAKPAACAPHGLDRSNCIIYEDYADLATQIARVDEATYERLQQNSYEWISHQTTEARAAAFLVACGCGTAGSAQAAEPRGETDEHQ